MRSFILPIPPGINATYRIGHKTLIKSDAAKDWEEECGYILIREKNKKPLGGLLKVTITMFLKNPLSCDIDMGIKAILDLFQRMGVYGNDKFIDWLVVRKLVVPDKDKENVVIEIMDKSGILPI